jgi:hypothetical protein
MWRKRTALITPCFSFPDETLSQDFLVSSHETLSATAL